MKYFFYLIFCLATSPCFSQRSGKEFNANVHKYISDSSSQFYYATLLHKLYTSPKDLTQDDLFFLYYGELYQSTYNPIGYGKMDGEFLRVARNNNHKKTIKIGLEILKGDPLNLMVLLNTSLSLGKKNDPDTTYYIQQRYYLLTRAILTTGDGMSKETAIKVTHINDEPIIKGIKGYFGGRDLLVADSNGIYTVWDTDKGKIYFQELLAKFGTTK